MMSHLHLQPRRLTKYRKRNGTSESSLSSSSSSSTTTHPNSDQTDLLLYSNQRSTTKTTTTSKTHFKSKPPNKSSSHQHFYDRNYQTVTCCYISSWSPFGRLKLWCPNSVSDSVMATQPYSTVHFPMQTRKKKLGGQQTREELEREVATLDKMLHHEQKVHEILEGMDNRKDGSPISIPNVLPPKMKEVLAELAMVEDEISRLETQISQLQTDLDHEKELTKQSKSKQWQHGTQKNIHGLSSVPQNPNPKNKGFNEKTTFDTKALHFISKAIKGDYNLSDFIINEKLRNSRGLTDQKENNFLEQIGLQERVSRKSGMLEQSPPLPEPRHDSTPKRERNLEIPSYPSQKAPSSPIQSEEESIHKWSPNKLSENLIKCLIFIFVRLLRTSRTMELEKLGPTSRSANFSSSFRAEPSLNSKASLMLRKELRQQDPYGIFDMEESIPRDIGPYKNLVRFTSSSMDPKCISNSSSIPLFQKLRGLMNSLQKVNLKFMTYQQKLAFWINIYNACIMHGVLQYGVPSSLEKLLTLMNKATLNIGGNTINAQAIEYFILRKPAASSFIKEVHRTGEKDGKEAIVRELYGLESSDPNVIFALCCGTSSSPAVRIYTGDGVVAELEKSKLEYLQASIVVKSTRRIALPELLLRNMHDFAEDMNSLVEWVFHQLPTSGSLRKSMVDCFKTTLHGPNISTIIDKLPYEFEFQYLLSI